MLWAVLPHLLKWHLWSLLVSQACAFIWSKTVWTNHALLLPLNCMAMPTWLLSTSIRGQEDAAMSVFASFCCYVLTAGAKLSIRSSARSHHVLPPPSQRLCSAVPGVGGSKRRIASAAAVEGERCNDIDDTTNLFSRWNFQQNGDSSHHPTAIYCQVNRRSVTNFSVRFNSLLWFLSSSQTKNNTILL